MKAVVIVLFAAGFLAAKAIQLGGIVGQCPPVDGPNPIYLLDKLNRHVFYQCSNGRPFLHECSSDLVFHPLNKVCQELSTWCKPCGQVGLNPTGPESVFLRDGCNAAIYYQCFNNRTITLKCKSGEIYNPFTEVCIQYIEN